MFDRDRIDSISHANRNPDIPGTAHRKRPYLMSAALAGLLLSGCATTSSAMARDGEPEEVRAITAEEKQLGAKAHPELLNEFGGAYDGPQTPYVIDIGKNIAVQSGLGNAREDFTVTLLNSPVNNAFAIPGGYIYVTRNLLGLMNDEAELAGVLGHEVGHVAARHSEKRQSAAKRNSIFGMIGQVASAVLLGNTQFGQLGQQVFGTGSQLLTLSYSRGQEREADDLGIVYLDRAGYDPKALSSMLYSLALQNQIDASAAGREGRGVPEWASTHPEPAKRVRRAADNANKLADSSGVRNREVFLNRIDGLLYDDDPAQGVIQGRDFLHPDLKLKFTVPSGYTMQNNPSAVVVNGQGGKAQFTLAPYQGNLEAYIGKVFQSASSTESQLTPGEITKTTINGIPAAYAGARTNNGQQSIDVIVFAYEFSKDRAYHFFSITEAGKSNAFNPMYASVTRLGNDEVGQIKSRQIDIVTVAQGDTIDSLSAKMAYDQLKRERFIALNGLDGSGKLAAGQRVKLVVYADE